MSVPSYMYQPENFGNEFSVLTYVSNKMRMGSAHPNYQFIGIFSKLWMMVHFSARHQQFRRH